MAQERSTICGRVVDNHGHPVANIFVVVSSVREDGSIDKSQTRTQHDGRFTANITHGDGVNIEVRWSTAGYQCRSITKIGSDMHDNLQIVLSRGATITGRVLHNLNHLNNLGIVLSPSGTLGGTIIRSDASNFEVPHVAPGMWDLTAVAIGLKRITIRGITVQGEETLDIGQVWLAAGKRLEGHVRDMHNVPVTAAHVFVGHWDVPSTGDCLSDQFIGHFEAKSDDNGRYIIQGIERFEGDTREPTVWASSSSIGSSLISKLPDDNATIDLYLLAVGDIEGRIEGLSGRPTTVVAQRSDEPPGARSAMVDNSGNFRFRSIPAGEYILTLLAPSCEPQRLNVYDGSVSLVRMKVSSPAVDVTLLFSHRHSFSVSPAIHGGRRWIEMSSGWKCTLFLVPPGSYLLSIDNGVVYDMIVTDESEEQILDLR